MHSISVVIPVYRGAQTLPQMVRELSHLTNENVTPQDNWFSVSELVLVFDNGGDHSDIVMRQLEDEHPFVRTVWLSKNFGQHAATLAGIASSSGDWVITLDEDGQQDPTEIGTLLDTAMAQQAQVVYGKPTNPPPHGALRNAASRTAKRLVNSLFVASNAEDFNSFRLILGSVARSVAAYSGSGAYLDVALGWVAGRYATAPVTLRAETRKSGYSLRGLMSHFWRLVLSSGTRGLRLVSFIGILFAVLGVVAIIWIILVKLTTGISAEGWASTTIVILITSGATLFSLGVIAEYIGVSVNMAMGKPAYVIMSDPATGPLGYSKRIRA